MFPLPEETLEPVEDLENLPPLRAHHEYDLDPVASRRLVEASIPMGLDSNEVVPNQRVNCFPKALRGNLVFLANLEGRVRPPIGE